MAKLISPLSNWKVFRGLYQLIEPDLVLLLFLMFHVDLQDHKLCIQDFANLSLASHQLGQVQLCLFDLILQILTPLTLVRVVSLHIDPLINIYVKVFDE